MSCHTYVYNDSSLGLFLKKIPSHVHTSHSLVRDMAHDWYIDMPSRVHIQGVDGSREWMRQVTQMKSHITHMKKSFHTHGNTSGRQRRGWLIRDLHMCYMTQSYVIWLSSIFMTHLMATSCSFAEQVLLQNPRLVWSYLWHDIFTSGSGMAYWEVGGWGRDPKKCTGRDWGMGSSTI